MKLPPRYRKFKSSSLTYPRKWKLRVQQKSPMDLQRDKIINDLRERAYELEARVEKTKDVGKQLLLMSAVDELRQVAAMIKLRELG